MTSPTSMPPPESIPRYPLEWPIGWRRTATRARQATAAFTKTVRDTRGDGPVSKSTRRVSLLEAVERLERQLETLGADRPTLSSNVRLRLDGRLDGRTEDQPSDPGVAVYFTFRGKATVLACDTYVRVADNIAALAAHIDALRRIERYGVGTIEQALAGYKALPADSASDWRGVFGFAAGARPSGEALDLAYKRLAKIYHPDVPGGSDDRMAWLNRARDYARSELAEGGGGLTR